MAGQTPLLQGTLDLLILKSLALQPLHGLGVSRRIEQITRGAYRVGPGSLFPALHRLEQQGWLRAQAGVTDTGREAKFYALTAAGRKQLARELESWERYTGAVRLVLQGAETR